MSAPGLFGHVLEMLVVGCFLLWFLLSVLVLVPKLRTWIRLWDLFTLVPEWRFFAPNPVQGDYYLLYRDQLADGTVTGWSEVRLGQKRRWWNVAWNPGKRASKALVDAIVELSGEAKTSPAVLVGSIPYLALLNYISSLKRFSSPAFTQFTILHALSSGEDREPKLVFASDLHSL